ncbi:MAG: rhodanese-like domain-containing protein [Flavobacteriales bacterium]|nr:rhodanese-like domain-containing protein [Flavobacteriales bacterium]MBL0036907.1 rhodanese-like domain-containing protein [Flavobacteriales bacterium]
MKKFFLPLLATAFTFLSCAAPQGGAGSGAVDTKSFQQTLATPNVLLIDVRTPAEYAEGHIDGALNLDWTGGVLDQRMATLDKGKPVLLYCASGRRSAAAREAMSAAGFSDVKDLSGGITSWRNAGLPVK